MRSGGERAWKQAHDELLPHVVSSGFGARFWVDAARDSDKLSGYLVKRMTGEPETLAAEFGKASQLPIAGPKGSRRWGCSRGFAPAHKAESQYRGGSLFRAPLEQACALDDAGQLEFVWASAGAYDHGAPLGLTDGPSVHVARAGRAARASARAVRAVQANGSRGQASEALVPAGRDGCDGGRVPLAEQVPHYQLSCPPALRPKGAGGHGHGVEFATTRKKGTAGEFATARKGASVARSDALGAVALRRLVSQKNKGPQRKRVPQVVRHVGPVGDAGDGHGYVVRR